MTICIAYKDKNSGNIICASDSCSTIGDSKHLVKPMKIYEKNGIVYLSSGTSGFIQTLMLNFDYSLPKIYDNIDNVVKGDFKIKLKEFCRENDLLDENNTLPNNLLIIINKRIYIVCSSFTIVESYHNYMAIGSGMDIALGVLYALENDDTKTIKEKIEIAINACNEFSSGCDNRIQWMEV